MRQAFSFQCDSLSHVNEKDCRKNSNENVLRRDITLNIGGISAFNPCILRKSML